MFGQGPIGSKTDVPQWILDLVSRVESTYGFCTSAIWFKEAKSNDYRGGCYRVKAESLQFYFRREMTIERIWVVLHELTHAFQHLERPDTLTPKPAGRKNRIHHNPAFFKFAAKFYLEFGGEEVLEFAAKNEYKRGRIYMQRAAREKKLHSVRV
jgi:hypothetical protein